jgi:single-strand DNA-binding protein
MNSCAFTGNLGGDVEVRDAGGTSVAGFSIAVNDPRNKDAAPMWVRCNLWGKRAEGGVIQYLKKGTQVGVTGPLKVNEFTKRDGLPGFTLELNVEQVQLLGGKANGGNGSPPLD